MLESIWHARKINVMFKHELSCYVFHVQPNVSPVCTKLYNTFDNLKPKQTHWRISMVTISKDARRGKMYEVRSVSKMRISDRKK